MALMDAGIPVREHVVGVSVGLVRTRKGITAIQLDIKPAGIPLDIICDNFEPARKARNQILDRMDQEISSARAINDGSSPRLATLSFSSDSLRKLLFHKKGIERETGARVSVSDGTIPIVAKTQPIMDKALEKHSKVANSSPEKTFKGFHQ
ncbi:hypothetical protein GUJ93_ZPchr0004g39401 [Zizania palustris]|uniref:Uncharacterized protein n=1 Tax=Zizania palustris TaxID=103762 RepID=A0A8J5SSH0_ZIZPA|nr:hypothetical protein GUJ93_ZPchr0004g39401 [Zizania palustris]